MSVLEKISSDARLQKRIARVLLIIGALVGIAWLATLDYGKKISTDILDLIPANERSPELAVVRSFANEKQSRVALFALRVPGNDDANRNEAARVFTSSLLASGIFTEAEIQGDTASRNALGKQLFDQRLALLLPGWLAKNHPVGASLATPVPGTAGVPPAKPGVASNAPTKSEFSTSLTERAASDLEKFMAKPEALAFNELIPADPLLLLPSLAEKVQSLDTSSDKTPPDTVLIWTLTRDNPLDPAAQQPVFDTVAAALASVRALAPDVTLRWTAVSRFAAESRAHIMREVILGNILSVIAVLAVAMICLPRILNTLNLAPVIFGALMGACVAVTLCFDRVHFLVFVLGLMLAGVSIDYGFYLYLQPRKNPGEHYADKVRRLMKPLLGSALTTVLGFSLLLFSDMPLVRQLGVFVSAGLLFALATAILWFAQIKNPWLQARAFTSAQVRDNPRTRRIAAALLAVVAIVAVTGPWFLKWRDNIAQLQPRTPQLTQEATELRALFGESPTRTIYLTRGATISEARDALEKFNNWHAAHFPNTATASLGHAIPLRADYEKLASLWSAAAEGATATGDAALESETSSQNTQSGVAATLCHRTPKNTFLQDFAPALRAALERHGFNSAEFEPFFNAWDVIQKNPPADYDATIAQLVASLRGQTALLMSTTPGSCWFVTVAEHPPGEEPPAALATVSLNQLESLNKLFTRYRLSALHLSAIGLALVGLSMWFIYGVRRGTLIFTTPVGSCLFAFGVLGLCGQTLNLFHLLGAFLGVCLSHNYAIFTAENDAHHEQPPPSIRLSALSTAASFGVLACSSIPVVSALGVTVTLIVLTALVIVELKRAARPRNVNAL